MLGVNYEFFKRGKTKQTGEDLYKAIFDNLDKYDDEFSRNLKIILSKALRTTAFTRDAHVRYLTTNAQDLVKKKEYWDQFSQLASFSKEGLPLQPSLGLAHLVMRPVT